MQTAILKTDLSLCSTLHTHIIKALCVFAAVGRNDLAAAGQY